MSISLTVEKRTKTGKQLAGLRSAGKIPAVLYGPKEDTVMLEMDIRSFEKVLKEAGESSIVTLKGLDSDKDVLMYDVAFDDFKGGPIHVDFYALEAGKELTISVPLEFVGEAPALKLGGTLTKVMHEIEITCMPVNLPQHIVVDISSLDTLESQIHVSDLVIPKGVTVEDEAEGVVALIQEVEEEVEEEVEAVDMDAIEVEKKGKAEDEEGSEEAA